MAGRVRSNGSKDRQTAVARKWQEVAGSDSQPTTQLTVNTRPWTTNDGDNLYRNIYIWVRCMILCQDIERIAELPAHRVETLTM